MGVWFESVWRRPVPGTTRPTGTTGNTYAHAGGNRSKVNECPPSLVATSTGQSGTSPPRRSPSRRCTRADSSRGSRSAGRTAPGRPGVGARVERHRRGAGGLIAGIAAAEGEARRGVGAREVARRRPGHVLLPRTRQSVVHERPRAVARQRARPCGTSAEHVSGLPRRGHRRGQSPAARRQHDRGGDQRDEGDGGRHAGSKVTARPLTARARTRRGSARGALEHRGHAGRHLQVGRIDGAETLKEFEVVDVNSPFRVRVDRTPFRGRRA